MCRRSLLIQKAGRKWRDFSERHRRRMAVVKAAERVPAPHSAPDRIIFARARNLKLTRKFCCHFRKSGHFRRLGWSERILFRVSWPAHSLVGLRLIVCRCRDRLMANLQDEHRCPKWAISAPKRCTFRIWFFIFFKNKKGASQDCIAAFKFEWISQLFE